MVKHLRPFLLACLVALAGSALAAAPVVLKVGAIVPEASPWGDALNRVAAEWSKVSNGQVQLKVYFGGIVGGESDSIRKMRLGQLQGAVLTSFGLNEITPEFLSLSIPFMVRNDEELDHVLAKVGPVLEAKIAAQKFKLLAWSKAGWVRFFSKKPVKVPNDLKAMKLAASPSDEALFNAWQSLGYNQVPVELPNTLTALNSNRIEALYASPIAVGGFQWFGLAKYMASIKIAPFLGGIVFTQAAWDRVPADVKPLLLAAAEPVLRRLDTDIKKLEEEAIKTMKGYGLIEVTASPADEALWKAEMEVGIAKLLGKSFSQEIYDQMAASLAEFRKK